MTEVKAKETKRSEADEIWEEIKDKSVEMFSLPNKKIEDFVERLKIPGAVLYLRPTAPAIIAAIGPAIGDKYEVNTTEKNYLQIVRKPPELDVEEETVTFQRGNKVETLNKAKYLGK